MSIALKWRVRHIVFFLLAMLLMMVTTQCGSASHGGGRNLVFEQGCYPYAVMWEGKCYYTMQLESADSIVLYEAKSAELLSKGNRRVVWHADSMSHIWSPELHRINDKWYLYFEADDGNTDNHQLYVLENPSENPMSGEFKLKGAIKTNDEWNFGLHPTSVIVEGKQYLLWSGWENRRKETETQCIYIARMENPWTLSSERVMLSKPELEWERQWINPNGDRSNYPIFVNENPEAFFTPDGRHVCVCYSASGIWTVYHSLGMLHARTDADLLDPNSWTKELEPLFVPDDVNKMYGTSNISLLNIQEGEQPEMLYEANVLMDEQWHRGIWVQQINWNKNGLPEFGKPLSD